MLERREAGGGEVGRWGGGVEERTRLTQLRTEWLGGPRPPSHRVLSPSGEADVASLLS